MASFDSSSHGLRQQLERAMGKRDLARALLLLDGLIAAEPYEARWPHKRGDLLLRLGHHAEAHDSYCRAAGLYYEDGRLDLARAMERTAESVRPPAMTES